VLLSAERCGRSVAAGANLRLAEDCCCGSCVGGLLPPAEDRYCRGRSCYNRAQACDSFSPGPKDTGPGPALALGQSAGREPGLGKGRSCIKIETFVMRYESVPPALCAKELCNSPGARVSASRPVVGGSARPWLGPRVSLLPPARSARVPCFAPGGRCQSLLQAGARVRRVMPAEQSSRSPPGAGGWVTCMGAVGLGKLRGARVPLVVCITPAEQSARGLGQWCGAWVFDRILSLLVEIYTSDDLR
jgi:hypothetical protein